MERDGVTSGSTEASWLDQLFGAAICTTPCHPYAQNNNNSALPSPTGLEPSAANGGLPTCTSLKMGPGARVSQVSAVQKLPSAPGRPPLHPQEKGQSTSSTHQGSSYAILSEQYLDPVRERGIAYSIQVVPQTSLSSPPKVYNPSPVPQRSPPPARGSLHTGWHAHPQGDEPPELVYTEGILQGLCLQEFAPPPGAAGSPPSIPSTHPQPLSVFARPHY